MSFYNLCCKSNIPFTMEENNIVMIQYTSNLKHLFDADFLHFYVITLQYYSIGRPIIYFHE